MPATNELDQDVYESNIKFWDRAWNGVKTAWTQMPDLPYLEQIGSNLQAKQSTKILDLGCGSGWLSVYLARMGFAVTGVDIAGHAIELAQQWAADEKLESAVFSVGDIAELQFAPGSFDAVVGNSIFEHLTYELAERTLRSLVSLLAPGGVFFGCFDLVGTGPGEFYELSDGTHVYTDKARSGMLLRCFSDAELKNMFTDDWIIESFECTDKGSRLVWAVRR